MTRERWENILDKISASFPEAEHRREKLDDGSGGTKEIVEFTSPLGKVKLEFTEKPRLLGEKTSYSRRIGANVNVEKKYDPDDMVSFLNAYKYNVDGWEKISANQFT